jgi:hypothetical protein
MKNRKKWEYDIRTISKELFSRICLDEWGDLGWELVQILEYNKDYLDGSKEHYYDCILKREYDV